MGCERCGSEENFVEIYREEYPCGCCGTVNNVVYEICINCGFIYKTYNGSIDDVYRGSLLSEEETPSELFEDIGKTLDKITEQVRIKAENNPKSMREMIHRCLKCDAIAYEYDEGKYKCSSPNCQFSWEVIDCG
jgi:hypothetical protein